MPVVRQQVRDGVHVVVADVARFRQLEGAAELEGVERLALVEVRYAVILSHGGHLALFLVGVRGEERIQRVLGPVRHPVGELAPDGDARRPRDEQAVAGLHALVDALLLLLGEVEQARPLQAVHGGLLEEHEEVGVEHDVLRGLIVEHRHGVLGDSGEKQAELAALVREAGEVVEHRGVGEQRLDLLDVQPRAHAALVVAVHAVSHRLAHVDEREHQHGVRQLAQVEVDDAVVEAHVGRAVEEGHGALDEALVAQRDRAGFWLGLFAQDLVEVAEERRVAAVLSAVEGHLNAARDDGLVDLRQLLTGLGGGCPGLRQHGVRLEGDLRLSRHMAHRHGVEGVERCAGGDGEVENGAAVAARDAGVLARTVDDEDLIGGVGQDRAGHLRLDEHALARSGLAGDESHRRRELLAVAED